MLEKFEGEAGAASFAVFLLTADDGGRARREGNELKLRARQNVILEFGYFIGRLDRAHVAVLYEQGVELPSHVQGIA